MILSRPDDRQNRAPAPSRSGNPGKPVWWRAAVVVLMLVGILGIFAIVFPSQFKHQLEISVVRQPTPYTQLFFSDPATLPKKLTVGRANKFSFTVINNEGHTQSYHYTVTITGAKLRKVASEGSLTLGDGQSITRTAGVEPPSRGLQYRIEVALTGTADFIQFYGNTSE
jgi:hypothetical protein